MIRERPEWLPTSLFRLVPTAPGPVTISYNSGGFSPSRGRRPEAGWQPSCRRTGRPCQGASPGRSGSRCLEPERHVVELPAQPGERQCAERSAEVAQDDVVEAGHQQQIDDDAPEPQRDDPGPDSGQTATRRPAAISITPTASRNV